MNPGTYKIFGWIFLIISTPLLLYFLALNIIGFPIKNTLIPITAIIIGVLFIKTAKSGNINKLTNSSLVLMILTLVISLFSGLLILYWEISRQPYWFVGFDEYMLWLTLGLVIISLALLVIGKRSNTN